MTLNKYKYKDIMQSSPVFKEVLANGMTTLMIPNRVIPKVSTQLWYGVGSKDETSGERGIAHLIEHMIFKGTHTLAECDIDMITRKLSGYTNAFTSYDYTGYLFNFPSQHWYEALPIMADCMRNCTFHDEFLSSELKAVIQELKMYKDDYLRSLIEMLISAMFPDHPYHYPIIGFKQDLWNLDRQSLVSFYEQHYVPNNATLVIVGDIDYDDALKKAHKAFGNIKPSPSYKKNDYYHSPDLKSYEVSIYRAVMQPMVVGSWIVPGVSKKKDYLIEIITWIIGSGKGSRLYKKLVDELELVTDFDVFNYDLFDYGLLFFYFTPKHSKDIQKIIHIIHEELDAISKHGVEEREITRAIKKTQVGYLSQLESNYKQAYATAKYFLATGDEHFFHSFLEYPKKDLAQEIKDFVATYLRPHTMSIGKVLPLEEKDKKYWLELQEISDQEDARILKGRIRNLPIGEPQCLYSIEVKPPKIFEYPDYTMFHLHNGLKVLFYDHKQLQKIDLIIDFKAKFDYDPQNLQGLCAFTMAMLLEGTKNYSASEFAQTLESYGMSLHSTVGQITLSLLSADLEKGLELLVELLTQATFKEDAIERVRAQMIAEIHEFWDTPTDFVMQLARQEVYKNHPLSKNMYGTLESVKAITREDILTFYKRYLSPKAARLSVVGDLDNYNMKELLDRMFAPWAGPEVQDLQVPSLSSVKKHVSNYEIMRDQTVLCYAGLSVSRLDPDYDALFLFDQIFTGGLLGSMSSRLFDLREQSGLFYTIQGSLIARSDLEKGYIYIKTIVSNDRLQEAEHAIENLIDTAIDTIEVSEFEEARLGIVNTLVDNFESNYKIASAFLIKDKFKFPKDYFTHRPQQLAAITIPQMQEAVRKYLSTNKLVKIRVGRINEGNA